MFIRKKKYPSGNVGVIVVEKVNGKMNELATIGIARHQEEIDSLITKGRKWIDAEQERRHPRLDLFGEESKKCDAELLSVEQMLSCITNISINGADLILDRVFDNVGFNGIDDEVFRQLVKARLSYPASKSATVEYLKNHFDEDVSLSKIYRYLDKLSDNQHKTVQDISVLHTKKILGGHIGVLFYDVTTLYFEADYEDELRKTGFSKEIRNESRKIQEWILEQPKTDCRMVEYDKGNGQRLLVGYTEDRARKDAYNREKGIRRLEKAYRRGTLTKDNINKREYNKFLKMEGDVKVTINYEKLEKDAKWDGLKGYLTNTNIPVNDVYAAYHNLWHVERAFRISKSKIEIRPMFHFTRRRIEAHVCICFVALKVYKELERLLKLSGINMSVDKVLELAKTIVTIQITLPQSKQTINKTMLMKRHQRIAPLFADEFWGTR